MSKLTFSFDKASGSARQAYRARVPGLRVRVRATGSAFRAADISSGGVFLEDAQSLGAGCQIEVDVLIQDAVIVSGIRAEVARVLPDGAGLMFTGLTQRQEERLDKLVLEIQKHLISKKQSGGSHIDDEQET
jgi:predicted NBD/HSP70 family sugar kinase